MTEINMQQMEKIEGGEGSFWSPFYAIAYAISYAVNSYVASSVWCECDPSATAI